VLNVRCIGHSTELDQKSGEDSEPPWEPKRQNNLGV
jgi:hypothetical protein